MRSAASFAINRDNDITNFSKEYKLKENCVLLPEDFRKALLEVKPQFGIDQDKLDLILRHF